MVMANVFRMEGLQGKLAMSWLPAAASFRYVRIVTAHSLCLEHLKLCVNSLQFGLNYWIACVRLVVEF